MGSYPQIADKRGTHDLYGPVSRMMCASYDRAMVMFLTCVKVKIHAVSGWLVTYATYVTTHIADVRGMCGSVRVSWSVL